MDGAFGKACGKVSRFGPFESGRLELPWKGQREGLAGLDGQTADLNALQIRLLGHVAARVVALEMPAQGFGGFEGGQTAALNAVKNSWLEHVAARVVALERPAGGFGGFEGKETAALNAVNNRWLKHVAYSCESCCLGKACRGV